MKRALWAALVVGLVAATANNAAEDKDAKDPLKGAWTVVSMVRDGMANEKAVGDKVTFDGGNITIQMKEKEHKGTFKLDTGKNPKHIDLTPGDGPDKDKTMEGIYALTKDELKICFAPSGNARPTTFESKEGSKIHLVTLKRAN